MKSKIGILYCAAILALTTSLGACSSSSLEPEEPATGPRDSNIQTDAKTEAAPEALPEIHAVPSPIQAAGPHATMPTGAIHATGSFNFSSVGGDSAPVHETAELKAVILPTDQYQSLVLKFTGYLHAADLKAGLKVVWRAKGYGEPKAVEFHFTCTPSSDPAYSNQCVMIPHYYYKGLDTTYVGWFHTDNLYQIEIDPAVAKVKDSENLKFEFTVPEYHN